MSAAKAALTVLVNTSGSGKSREALLVCDVKYSPFWGEGKGKSQPRAARTPKTTLTATQVAASTSL
jgi:hypothetical protein